MSGSYVSVAFHASSTEQVQNSPDAITWTARGTDADGSGGYCIAASSDAVIALLLDSSGFTSIAIASTDGGASWTTYAIPQHFQYAAIAYGNGVWLGMDFLGHIIRSTDGGATWADAATLASNDGGWQALAYGAGLFVAVGCDDSTGKVISTSPDGLTWTSRTSTADKLWQGVTYDGGQFVAVGGPNALFGGLPGNSCVMTSSDGIAWTAQTSAGGSSFSWRALAYGAGIYVAVAKNSNGTLMTSPDGVTWSTLSIADASSCYGIIYGGGQFVISQDDATSAGLTILTSPDGTTWTTQTSALPDHVTATAYVDPCATLSVSCGSPPSGSVGVPYTHTFPHTGGDTVYFSISSGSLPPGLALDPATGIVSGTPTTNGAYSFTVEIQFAQVLATGDDGSFTNSKIVIASKNGSIWEQRTTDISDSGWSVIYSPAASLWLNGTSFSGTGIEIQTSPDGDTWTARTSPADGSWLKKMVSGNGQIVALYGSSSLNIITSPDGITWTFQTIAGSLQILGSADISYSPDLDLYCIVTVSDGGVSGSLTSTDGITWTHHPHTALDTQAITWGKGLFVAVGGQQGSGIHLFTSPDGTTWTDQADPGGNAEQWNAIHYANGRFVIVSTDTGTNPGNQAAYSDDALTWTIVATPGSAKTWSCVTYGYGIWLAGAENSASTQPLMMSSDNGVTWSLIPAQSFSFGFIEGIAFGPSGDCFDIAGCSITIGGVALGNTWRGGFQQRAGNTLC